MISNPNVLASAILCAAFVTWFCACAYAAEGASDVRWDLEDGRWTAERANAWYAEQGWLAGANFVPSTEYMSRGSNSTFETVMPYFCTSFPSWGAQGNESRILSTPAL